MEAGRIAYRDNKEYRISRLKPIRVRGAGAPDKQVRSRVEGRVEARAEARVRRGSQVMALKPEFDSILVEDVAGAGRVRYTPPPPPVNSGGLPAHNPFAPHPPHSDDSFSLVELHETGCQETFMTKGRLGMVLDGFRFGFPMVLGGWRG